MIFIEIIGWAGAILFAISALPQAIKTFKTKKAKDLSLLFLIFFLSAALLSLAYLLITDMQMQTFHWPLYLNYSATALISLYLIYAKTSY